MELDTTFFLLAVPAVVFAGISKGGFGSGGSFAATPILALVRLGQERGLVRAAVRPAGEAAGVATGVVAGFTSFVSHAGGPPVAIYLLSQRLTKTGFQATTVLVFGVVNVFKVVPYAFLGLLTLETLWANVLLIPAALLGAWLGVKAHGMVSERAFFALTYVLLTITGTKLIWDALT